MSTTNGSTIVDHGFVQFKADSFIALLIALLIYVDDILIISNHIAVLQTKLFLDHKFKLKDLECLKFFLRL